MKIMTRAKPAAARLVWPVALALAMATGGLADVDGTIVQKTDRRPMTGKIRWQAVSKVYSVTVNNVEMKISPNQVAEIRVSQPAELEPAVRLVRSGKYDEGIPLLEKIVTDYTMLQWDVIASQWLAEALLKKGEADKASQVCDKIVRMHPETAYTGDFARVYWAALLAANRDATLKDVLTIAVEQGTREIAAVAQVMRGDIARKKGELKEALVDGYLRTIVFFKEVKTVQPEALYDAMKCFEELGQTSYADKMRKKLLAEYPGSDYAAKVKSGA